MAINIAVTEKDTVTGLTVAGVAGGSLSVGTTYYYKLVAVEYADTTVASWRATAYSAVSAEVSYTATSTNKSVKLDWVPPANILPAHFTAYLILRTTVSGDYSSATAKLINAAPGLSSSYATTTTGVSTFTDDGTRVLNQWATYTLGIPKVVVDTTAGSVVTEELIYQSYVSNGKTQFATKNAGQRGLGAQYYLCGMFNMGYTSGISLMFTSGTSTVLDGNLDIKTATTSIITMGSSLAPGGATLGLMSCAGDGTTLLRGIINLYNSKVYDAGQQLGVGGNTGYYSGAGFKGFAAAGASVIKNCQILSYNGNTQFGGNISISGTLLELNPRHEIGGGLVPTITDATINGVQLYTYGAQYVVNKRCTLLSGTNNALFFHGASSVWRRYFDLIDFTPPSEPPRGGSATNPSGAIYQRKWSLNASVVTANDAPIPNMSISVTDKNGASSVFLDSGTTTNTSNYSPSSTAISVLDGTKVSVGDVIRVAAELMLVTAKAGNVLTVTRGYMGSFANDYLTQCGFVVWLMRDVARSNASGVFEEQYLTSATYQGNGAKALPYMYDTEVFTPHTITLSKYGYQRVTLTQTVAAPIKLAQRMLADAYISATESVAMTYTGIAVDIATGTITLTESHSLAEVYDYVQWWFSLNANVRHAIALTTTNGVDYSLSYDLTVDGCTLTGTGRIAMPLNVLTLITGGDATVGIDHSTGTLASINVTGYTLGSRLQVFDATAGVEVYNDIPATTVLSLSRNWGGNHLLRIRMARVIGLDADLPMQTFVVFEQSGAQLLLTPEPDLVYEANGIDGDTVLEFTADFPNVQIDVSDPDGVTTPQRVYAWYASGQMTAPGIANFHGGMTADDAVNYRINVGVLDMRVQNVSSLPCVISGARLYRDDGSSIFSVGVGPIQADPNKAYVAQGGSGPSAAAIASAVWAYSQ